jgi:protein-tyrosine phosphatase
MRTPPRLLATLLLASVLVVPGLVGPSAATAAPAPAAPAVKPDPRHIKLAGTENTRDFATYRTVDGHALNLKVIRSDNLSKLTPADQRKLAGLGLAAVVDLRTDIERALQPDRPVPGARHYDANVFGRAAANAFDLPAAYRMFASDPHARAEFARTLRLVSATLAQGRAVLFHCTAGKDRTGWTAAMLLTIAGVDRATVDRDYLASNKFLHATPGTLEGVNLAWLQASFATADKLFGSFDGYLRNGLRLSPAEISTLRSQLRAG